MFVEKNGKMYEVLEFSKHWSVRLQQGALSVDFQVSKDICKTDAEIKEYILNEKMF